MNEQQLIDRKARVVFSENVQRILAQMDKTVGWLQRQTGDNLNRIYPAVAGETNVSAGVLVRIASALGVKVDDLIPVTSIVPPTEHGPDTHAKKKLGNNLKKIA